MLLASSEELVLSMATLCANSEAGISNKQRIKGVFIIFF
jgi:hypothetical protein